MQSLNMDEVQEFNMSAATAVPILAFFVVVLSVPPFVWHVKNRNLAASSLVFWIVLSNIFNFVNSVIWPDDNLDAWWRGYVLCDIEVKLMNAANVGGPSSIVAIMRSLALVLDTNKTTIRPTSAQQKRKFVVDALLCFGPPIWMILVHYIVQGIRYYIFAVSGCIPALDNSWPSIVLIHIWSPTFSLADVYYSILVIHRIRKYRQEFAAILHASNSGLTRSRFQRLFLMSLTLTLVAAPLQFYTLYKNCVYPMIPYSWSRIHGPAWWDIILIPNNGEVTYDRWIQIGVGFIVFLFFGTGNDAVKMYRQGLVKAGFGKIFPRLLRTRERRPSVFSENGSFRSRAYSFVKGKLSRGSVASSDTHTHRTSTSITTITSSPKLPQRPLSPLSLTETVVRDQSSPSGPNRSTVLENPNADILQPSIPEPAAHPAASRLARFLATTRVSHPYNGIHATSLVRPSTDVEMQATGMSGTVHARDYAEGK